MFKTIFFAFLFSLQMLFAGLDLNNASQKDLESLPGVGEKLAQEIIKGRPFKSVEDLKNVKGIGDAKFEKIKGLVAVGSDTSVPAPAPVTATEPVTKPTVPVAVPAPVVEKTKAVAARASKLAPGQKVSLNNASVEELEMLPGIGKKKAEAIIGGRPYQALEDVMKVKGIKMGIFNKIKDFISL